MTNKSPRTPLRFAVLTAVSILSSAGLSAGQNISRAEYFWDTDPGINKGIAIQSLPDLNPATLNIPTDGLEPGVHLLGLRVGTSDAWSVTKTSWVTVPKTYDRTLTGAEYFWDTDPGIGNATPLATLTGNLAGQNEDFPLTINANDLSDGTHLLGLRLKTANAWSVTKTSRVTVKSGEIKLITAVEYFWGNDPGEGNGTAIEIVPASRIEINPLTIPFPEAGQEEYTLSIRGMADGKWGSVTTWTRQNVPVEAVALNKTAIELETGNSETLSAVVTPENALFKDIDWLTDAEEIATVDHQGLVEAKLQGVANISARSRQYPDIAASCEVTVTEQHSALKTPNLEGISVIAGQGYVLITGEGSAKGEVFDASGLTLARLDDILPIKLPLAPGLYMLTINGSTSKIIIR